MHVQILSSGSQGNAMLVRAGETYLVVDAGLPMQSLDERFAAAHVTPRRVDHIALTHGHLDHARTSGRLAKRADATLHCCEALMRNSSIAKAKRMAALRPGTATRFDGPRGDDGLSLMPVLIPHDANPTVAMRIAQDLPDGERVLVLVTDMGRPDEEAARRLVGAHVLVLEFNHDEELLRNGPYPSKLKQRVLGNGGHLSNDQAARMLRRLAGPELHTLVLAHLSETNNTPALALEAARGALAEMGREDVRVLVASQHDVGPNLEV